MINRISICMASLLMVLLFSSCSQKAKVGVIFDLASKGRWEMDKALIIQELEERGADVFFRASEGNAELQYPYAEEMIKQGVEVLIVSPTDLNASANIVALAHDNGIKVIAYDRIIRNCDLDFYISFDDVQVGELQTKYALEQCPKGKYAILGGAMSDHNSFLIRLGQLNNMREPINSGAVRVVFDQYAYNWIDAEGYRMMKECLSEHADVCVVLAASDGLATGAVQALEEVGVSPLPVVCGQDAQLIACQRILTGKQGMTVYKPIKEITRIAAEAAMMLVEEGRLPEPNQFINNAKVKVPSILLSSIALDSTNLLEVITRDGYYTREALLQEVD